MSKYIIFLLFVYISLIVKEFPPFTKVIMYNTFPEKASVFYLTDSTGKIISVKDHFHYSIFEVSHNASVLPTKDSMEMQLLQILKSYQKENKEHTKVHLHHVELRLENIDNVHEHILEHL